MVLFFRSTFVIRPVTIRATLSDFSVDWARVSPRKVIQLIATANPANMYFEFFIGFSLRKQTPMEAYENTRAVVTRFVVGGALARPERPGASWSGPMGSLHQSRLGAAW